MFDSTGGFWFTDHGKMRARTRDRGGFIMGKQMDLQSERFPSRLMVLTGLDYLLRKTECM